jgi:hypothetical protein
VKNFLVVTATSLGLMIGAAVPARADGSPPIPPGSGCKGLTNAYMRVVENRGRDSNAAQRLREQMRRHGCECPGHH